MCKSARRVVNNPALPLCQSDIDIRSPLHLQGTTHTAVTPLDIVKCRRQVDPNLYRGNFEAWGKIYRAESLRGIFTGWAPTFFGYSVCLSHKAYYRRPLHPLLRYRTDIDYYLRLKVLSNMVDMNSSKSSMAI